MDFMISSSKQNTAPLVEQSLIAEVTAWFPAVEHSLVPGKHQGSTGRGTGSDPLGLEDMMNLESGSLFVASFAPFVAMPFAPFVANLVAVRSDARSPVRSVQSLRS